MMKRSLHPWLGLLVYAACALPNVAAAQTTAYSSLVDPLPGNVDSQCFECDRVNEFGDKVALASGVSRRLDSVAVTLSSWACEKGSGVTCNTKKGKTFNHPVTLKLYAANPGSPDLPGTELASVTSTFAIPYRPSADPKCPDTGLGAGTGWRASPTQCFNGKAVDITFDLHALGLILPPTLIWSVTYDTQSAGYNPLGVPGPYNSLNVGLSSAATVGTDVDPNGAFMNSSNADWYCDGGAGGVDVFRNDTDNTNSCWSGLVPAARIRVWDVPHTAGECKKNGWKTLTRLDGSLFASQAACEQYVKTGV